MTIVMGLDEHRAQTRPDLRDREGQEGRREAVLKASHLVVHLADLFSQGRKLRCRRAGIRLHIGQPANIRFERPRLLA